MEAYRNKGLALLACWLVSHSTLFGAQNALIVIGVTGSSSVSEELNGAAQNIHDGLVQRGFAADSVEILQPQQAGGRVTSDLVLQSLKKRQGLGAKDEFWLVLLGFSGLSADNVPAFQVSGPRLTVTDLKSALDAIPARQYVFVGTSDSGSFISPLLAKNRDVLAATRDQGEVDLPRFPEAWGEALKNNPQESWKEIAARAAVITEKAYTDYSLAVGEHARLGDPETGQILEAPFGADNPAKPAESAASDGSMALVNASDIKVDIRKPNAEWEHHPATPETKKIIETARATPNPDGFSSIMLEQRLGYRVGEDRSAENFTMQRIYLAKEDGVARWANFLLPQDPPAITTKLVEARIIQPDGSSTVFNPAKMPPATDCSSGLCGALTMVFMPDAHAGCVVEIAYRTRQLLDAGQPDFSEELPVQGDIPAVLTELQLQVPANNKVHFKLRNSDQEPAETLVDGLRTLSWKMENMPAFEPLPYDPPERDSVVALDVSSLDSWDSFATWYKRLAKGSDEQDDAVKAKAADLADGAKTRMDKIRKAYEFVSALRYVAIEFGINGIRPRSPAVVLENRYGDCKDKANLLIALLTDMGIDARFTVLNRGSSTDVSFPSWQFNHAIAYVPKAPEAGQPEDLWLDTTDSTAPFPTLSPGDIGRNALVFDKDSAKFLTIAPVKDEMTTIDEKWMFNEKAQGAGSWDDGTLQVTWSGLAEYDMRSQARGRTPRQRDYLLQSELIKQLPDANFTKLDLSPADDLSQPMRLNAVFNVSPDNERPGAGIDLDSYFAASERDRPLEINDGEKLHLIQTVEHISAHEFPVSLPSNFDQTAAGVHATISYVSDGNQRWTRVAELTIDQPLIAKDDYVPVRSMLRNWSRQLTSR